MLFNAMVWSNCCVIEWNCGVTQFPFREWNKMRKSANCSYVDNWDETLTFYLVMLLETGARPMEVLTMQRKYKYITKVKNMFDHGLPKQAWNIGCKVHKNKKDQTLLDG